MADEAKSKPVNSAPPSAPPPIVTQTRARDGRPWLALLIYLLIALIVAVIIVLGGRWLYHAIRDENEPAKKTATTSTSKTAEQKAASEDEKSQSSSSNKSSNSASSGQATSSGSQSGSNSSGSTDELANTGPGQVATLFVSVSLAAAGLHYAYQRRRTS